MISKHCSLAAHIAFVWLNFERCVITFYVFFPHSEAMHSQISIKNRTKPIFFFIFCFDCLTFSLLSRLKLLLFSLKIKQMPSRNHVLIKSTSENASPSLMPQSAFPISSRLSNWLQPTPSNLDVMN